MKFVKIKKVAISLPSYDSRREEYTSTDQHTVEVELWEGNSEEFPDFCLAVGRAPEGFVHCITDWHSSWVQAKEYLEENPNLPKKFKQKDFWKAEIITVNHLAKSLHTGKTPEQWLSSVRAYYPQAFAISSL